NPITRWQEQLDRARQWMEDLRYADAARLLTDLLIDVRGLEGSAVDAYLPVTYGLLGECHFHSGQADKALAPTERALELTTASGPVDGQAAYLGNLYEAHRYLGRAEQAADNALRLAAVLEGQGKVDEARRYRRQAEVVRAGEPPNRIVLGIDGRRY